MQNWSRVGLKSVGFLMLLILAAVGGSVATLWQVQADEEKLTPEARETIAFADKLSRAFGLVADRIQPSVVYISSLRKPRVIQRTPDMFGMNELEREMLERFFGRNFRFDEPRSQQQPAQRGLGSGVIIRADGYILTNRHVVADADELKVTLADGRDLQAELVGADEGSDLAVLKVEATGLPTAELDTVGDYRVGDWVLACGNPFGLSQTVTAGIISARGRSFASEVTQYEDFIQTDAAINPGNSGGPLVNLEGKVIGINTFIVSRSGGNMGIGFAIPATMAAPVVSSLIETGEVRRGYLGVLIQELTPELAKQLNFSDKNGVVVAEVTADGPAASAGIKAGDIIVRWGDRVVNNPNELRLAVAATKPGETISVHYYRNGNEKTAQVKVAELDLGTLAGKTDRPAPEKNQEEFDKFGLSLQDLTPELARRLGLSGNEGILITDVDAEGIAAKAGLKPKEVIISVEGTTVTSLKQFRDLMNQANLNEGVLVQVRSQTGVRFVVLKNGNS